MSARLASGGKVFDFQFSNTMAAFSCQGHIESNVDLDMVTEDMWGLGSPSASLAPLQFTQASVNVIVARIYAVGLVHTVMVNAEMQEAERPGCQW